MARFLGQKSAPYGPDSNQFLGKILWWTKLLWSDQNGSHSAIFPSMAIRPLVKRLTRLRIYALAMGDRTMESLNPVEDSAKRVC